MKKVNKDRSQMGLRPDLTLTRNGLKARGLLKRKKITSDKIGCLQVLIMHALCLNICIWMLDALNDHIC